MTQDQLDTIAATWNQYSTSPVTIMNLMQQYGVSAADLVQATGIPSASIANYFYANGAPDGFAGATPAAIVYVPPPQPTRAEQLATIAGTWAQNNSNPATVMNLMAQYSVDIGSLVEATGLKIEYFTNYFYNAGAPDGFAGLPSKTAWYVKTHPVQVTPPPSSLTVVGGGLVTPNNAVIPVVNTATQAPRTNVVDTSATSPVSAPVVVTQVPLANTSGGGAALAWLAAGAAVLNFLG